MDDLRRSIVCAHCVREDASLNFLRQNQISLRQQMQIRLGELRSIGNGECQGNGVVHLSPEGSRSFGQFHRSPIIEDCD